MTNVASCIEDILSSEDRGSVARKVYSIMRPRRTGYIALRQQANSLVIHQALLDKAIRGCDSPFSDCYYSMKGFLYQLVFGERQLSIDELFDVQLDNLFELNFNLRSITSESRRELGVLRDYNTARHKELQRCVGSIDSSNSSVDSKAKEYFDLQQQVKSIGKKDENFFVVQLKLRDLKYDISEISHKYNIMNEAILDLGEEVRFLGVVEDLLINSVQLSEHIAFKAKRIERHISATKDAYSLVKAQQEAVISLDDAVTRMTRFTLGVHNILSSGLQDMSSTMNSCSNLNSFYPSAVKGLGGVVNSVSEANLLRNQDAERAVNRYLSDSRI